ncbi:MAG: OB-fold nucleic acid binding domain-containing protein, partial [Clostridia bacterium]|nr:OB-fold nucleic acid binding domain-containing protein [Clostridia bacterium]
MGKYTLIHDLFRSTPADGARVTVAGWVRTVRDSKAFAFIELNDGTFFKNLQIVLDETVPGFREMVKVTLGSA